MINVTGPLSVTPPLFFIKDPSPTLPYEQGPVPSIREGSSGLQGLIFIVFIRGLLEMFGYYFLIPLFLLRYTFVTWPFIFDSDCFGEAK